MKRRNFIKSILALTGIGLAPKLIGKELPKNGHIHIDNETISSDGIGGRYDRLYSDLLYNTDWSIKGKDIRYIGTGNKYTVLEFHQLLKNKYENITGINEYDPYLVAMSEKITDQYIELANGYNIDEYAAHHLTNGVIYSHGDIFAYGDTPLIE